MIGRMRRLRGWLFALPFLAGSTLAAHVLAYRMTIEDAHERAHILRVTGHSYLHYAPAFLGAAAAFVVIALAVRVHRGRRGGFPPWACAALAPLAFVLQEHLERLLHGSAPLPALEPTLWVGLALQIPLAFAALLVARLLLGAADRIGATRAPEVSLYPFVPMLSAAAMVAVRRTLPLATGYAGRAPPR
jgi:hypothetical protein